MGEQTALETVLKRDRGLVAAGLAGLAALSWAYMFYLAWKMDSMASGMEMAMPRMESWSGVELFLLFLMWAVMMVAMMIPSAAPMILLFASINRKRLERRAPFVPTAIFVAGYLLIWTAFSGAATLAQWALHEAALLSEMMVGTSPLLGAALLVSAGVFQWLPWKHACLKRCRSPLSFLSTEWREGRRGALMMGLKHGAYCAGCCWALMALLFVGGVMNLLWVAAIAAFVLVEKIAPSGFRVARVAGAALALWGVWMGAGALA